MHCQPDTNQVKALDPNTYCVGDKCTPILRSKYVNNPSGYKTGVCIRNIYYITQHFIHYNCQLCLTDKICQVAHTNHLFRAELCITLHMYLFGEHFVFFCFFDDERSPYKKNPLCLEHLLWSSLSTPDPAFSFKGHSRDLCLLAEFNTANEKQRFPSTPSEWAVIETISLERRAKQGWTGGE